jgi:hypothetical protein
MSTADLLCLIGSVVALGTFGWFVVSAELDIARHERAIAQIHEESGEILMRIRREREAA